MAARVEGRALEKTAIEGCTDLLNILPDDKRAIRDVSGEEVVEAGGRTFAEMSSFAREADGVWSVRALRGGWTRSRAYASANYRA